MQCFAPRRMHQQLAAETTGAPFHGCRNRPHELHTLGQPWIGNPGGLGEEALPRRPLRGFRPQQGQKRIRRQNCGLAFRKRRIGEGGVAAGQERLQERMARLMGLQQNFTGAFTTPGPSRYLSDQLPHTLWSAEIRGEKALVHVHDSRQRDIGEVMALRQHLCAH